MFFQSAFSGGSAMMRACMLVLMPSERAAFLMMLLKVQVPQQDINELQSGLCAAMVHDLYIKNDERSLYRIESFCFVKGSDAPYGRFLLCLPSPGGNTC